ncbi:MAG: hypothetical protein INR65_00845 [Gluconacetobacter diazotrophicus]|nr:hypothetical protein [Gluconacetobacter diazotrophicus]
MSGSTTINNHPSSAVLLDHAAGSLSFAHYCVVATHLLRCPDCRDAVSFWEKIGNARLAAAPPLQPPSGLLERCLASIDRYEASRDSSPRPEAGPVRPEALDGTILPPPLRSLKPGRLRWLAPGIRHRTLWHDDRGTLHLIRVRPGVSLSAHRHRGLELTCVLGGAYRADGRRFDVGDLSEEEDDDEDNLRGERDHVVVAEPSSDCICIMATTGRLRFSGWLARLFQPVMPF